MTGAAVTALVDAGVWALCSVAVGYGVQLVPRGALERDTWLTRLRPWERDGRAYERARIRRWKDRVPEAGAAFRRGASKRALPGRSSEDLDRFVVETRRAEYVHVALLAISPVFALWNPWPLTVAMVAYAIVANVPFIAIQRYNRARLQRVVRARGAAVAGRR